MVEYEQNQLIHPDVVHEFNHCPHCGEGDLEADGSPSWSGGDLRWTVHCTECGTACTEVYRFVRTEVESRE